MPLRITQLEKIKDLKQIVGKKVIIEEDLTILKQDMSKYLKNNMIDIDRIVFKSQLPGNVLLLKQGIDRTAISGALKNGFVPIFVDANNIVVEVYGN